MADVNLYKCENAGCVRCTGCFVSTRKVLNIRCEDCDEIGCPSPTKPAQKLGLCKMCRKEVIARHKA